MELSSNLLYTNLLQRLRLCYYLRPLLSYDVPGQIPTPWKHVWLDILRFNLKLLRRLVQLLKIVRKVVRDRNKRTVRKGDYSRVTFSRSGNILLFNFNELIILSKIKLYF